MTTILAVNESEESAGGPLVRQDDGSTRVWLWRAYWRRVTDDAQEPPLNDPLQQIRAVETGLAQPFDAQTTSVATRRISAPPPKFEIPPWTENFIVLARWSGRVLEVGRAGVVAALTNDLDPSAPEEEADIPLEEISEVDRSLVTPGALFLWSIGYRIHASGQRSRESVVLFRRLPRWSPEEIERARQRVSGSKLRIEYGGAGAQQAGS
jgi:hypothetical protein